MLPRLGLIVPIVFVCGASFGATPSFTDATASAGLTVSHNAQLMRTLFPPSVMFGGGAIGDFDRDGDQDLFFLGGDSPDRLYINDGTGSFTDQAAAWGVQVAHMGAGCAVGDYNADGWLDIFVTSVGPSGASPVTGAHKLYRNNGDGTFTDVAASAGVSTTSSPTPDGYGSAFGDYDLDGDLDLFVTSWQSTANGNILFRNNNDGTFTDVTTASGLNFTGTQGFSPRFIDMDGDRYPELLLAADFMGSRYFVNNGDATFTDQTAASGTGLDGNGMGQYVGDLNNDGLFEWYVTSIFLEPDEGKIFGGNVPGTGNMLYRCVASHLFNEDGGASGVKDGGWGWGTIMVDFDHDMYLDILETNGWNVGIGLAEQNYLWHNQANGTFTEMALAAGMVYNPQGRGLASLDVDADGDQDVVNFAWNGAFTLWENLIDQQPDTHWLRVFLDTSSRPDLAPDGFGSRVQLTAGGVTQLRSINGGCNYLISSELSAHFGIGALTTIDELRVTWNDGRETVLTGIAPDQTLTLNAPCDGDADANGIVDVNDIAFTIFRLGDSGTPGLPGDVDGNGVVDINDVAYVIFRLATCQ